MPLYADRFSGHLEAADFRTPLFGAAGCTWPTIPAQRYYLSSTNATGLLTVLNFTGILVIQNVPVVNHDDIQWVQFGPHPFTVIKFRKLWVKERPGYNWELVLDIGSACGPALTWTLERPIESCNRDVIFGNKACQNAPSWTTGSTFSAKQVEFDQGRPP